MVKAKSRAKRRSLPSFAIFSKVRKAGIANAMTSADREVSLLACISFSLSERVVPTNRSYSGSYFLRASRGKPAFSALFNSSFEDFTSLAFLKRTSSLTILFSCLTSFSLSSVSSVMFEWSADDN